MRHPLGYHAKFEQRWRHAFNRQNVWMFCSLANYNFFAVFLENRRSARNPIVDAETPHLIDLVDRILFIHAKRLDGEHLIGIHLVGDPPNISESPWCERPLARLAERGGNYVGNGKDSIYATRLPQRSYAPFS